MEPCKEGNDVYFRRTSFVLLPGGWLGGSSGSWLEQVSGLARLAADIRAGTAEVERGACAQDVVLEGELTGICR